MNFLLPTGIGDSVWALHKIEAIRDVQDPGGEINVSLIGGTNEIDSRALDFVKRFSFVTNANMKPFKLHKDGDWINRDGTYNYVDDGMYEFGGERYCILVPNAPLERGERLESWLPHYPICWDIWRDFRIDEAERQFAVELEQTVGPYCVFYPGPLHGNTTDGHNRNALWRPEDWVNLGRRIHSEFGLHIVAVGAPYDGTYYEWMIRPLLKGDAEFWTSVIGKTNLGQLWATTSRAEFVVSYQAGVGIVSTYLGTPTAIFWRPYGDSISPQWFLSFDERMASAWVPPATIEAGLHLPLIYKKHGVDFIVSEIHRRGWADAKVVGYPVAPGVVRTPAGQYPSE